ncbi:hypothetical protein NDN08_002086 [Rhodosorus marinus]|uniref:Calcium-binding protein n=1 Tax=Rhodosorus marinus TaxID=101924 RepID=A0AAV8UST6_9RHOD|nr:hypothetical protein NDN08_002086 [Rhodosorus marinus]
MTTFIKLSLLAMVVAVNYASAQSTCSDFPMPPFAKVSIPPGDTATVPVPERRVFWARDTFCRDMRDQFNIMVSVCMKNNYDRTTGVTSAKLTFRTTRLGYYIKRVRVGLLEGSVDEAHKLDDFQLDESGDNLTVVRYDYTMSPAASNCCKTFRTLTIVADIEYNGVNRQAIIDDSRCRGTTGGCLMKIKCPHLFVGTDIDDRIFGTMEADVIIGNGGNDYLHGSGAQDFIFGDDGDDIIKGGNGKDSIYGGEGNDVISLGGGKDTAWGEGGDDIFKDLSVNGSEYDYVNGGDGYDRAYSYNLLDNKWVDIEHLYEGRPSDE